MRRILILLFLLPALAFAEEEEKENPWNYITSKYGFNIYSRKMPDSDFVQFKGYGVIKAPILHIMATLDDVDTHDEWISQILEVRELEKISDKERIVYYASKSPWPLTNRDFIIRAKVRVDEKKRWIHISSKETTSSKMPEKEDFVRIQRISIQWSFRPTNGGKHTFIQFKSHANPGGYVPAWAVNFYGRYMALDTMRNLEKSVLSNKPNQKFIQKYKQYLEWQK